MKRAFLTLFCILIIYSHARSQDFYLNIHHINGTEVTFQVRQIEKITFSGIISDMKLSENLSPIIKNFMLFQNYPNPFNLTTAIEFQIPKAGKVEIEIFNIEGKLIKKFTNTYLKTGNYRLFWDGKDNLGTTVASGLYIYQIKFNNLSLSKRMILIK